MLRQLIHIWREQRIKCFIFIDDGIADNLDAWTLQRQGRIIKQDLLFAGCVPHKDKSVWIPTKVVSRLGFTVDLLHNVISARENKIAEVIRAAEFLCTRSSVPARKLAQGIGLLISLQQALGDIVYLPYQTFSIHFGITSFWELECHGHNVHQGMFRMGVLVLSCAPSKWYATFSNHRIRYGSIF